MKLSHMDLVWKEYLHISEAGKTGKANPSVHHILGWLNPCCLWQISSCMRYILPILKCHTKWKGDSFQMYLLDAPSLHTRQSSCTLCCKGLWLSETTSLHQSVWTGLVIKHPKKTKVGDKYRTSEHDHLTLQLLAVQKWLRSKRNRNTENF